MITDYQVYPVCWYLQLVVTTVQQYKLKVTMESKFVVPNYTEKNQMMSGECISSVFVINLCDFGIFKSL